MSLKFVSSPPAQVTFTPDDDDIAKSLTPADVEQIAEIFQTPLTGAYNWDYEEADKRIRKLYRLGKERNWDADLDVNWDRMYSQELSPMVEGGENPYAGWEPFEKLSPEDQNKFA
jgi:hypothetical protein